MCARPPRRRSRSRTPRSTRGARTAARRPPPRRRAPAAGRRRWSPSSRPASCTSRRPRRCGRPGRSRSAAAATRPGDAMSPRMTRRRRRRRSTPPTSLPSARNRSTSARPMNPFAPVTKTFWGDAGLPSAAPYLANASWIASTAAMEARHQWSRPIERASPLWTSAGSRAGSDPPRGGKRVHDRQPDRCPGKPERRPRRPVRRIVSRNLGDERGQRRGHHRADQQVHRSRRRGHAPVVGGDRVEGLCGHSRPPCRSTWKSNIRSNQRTASRKPAPAVTNAVMRWATLSAHIDALRLDSALPMTEAALDRVEVDGLTIAYRELGSGPPVLLLHGWPRPRTCGVT